MAEEGDWVLEGGCTCRAVRYRITSRPMFVHCCHCRWCQRQTGASFDVNAMIEFDRVILLQGAPESVSTPSPSGKGQKIIRCPNCRVAVLEPLRRFRRCGVVRSFRHSRRTRSTGAGHPHLHEFEATVGRVADGHTRRGRVVRSQ